MDRTVGRRTGPVRVVIADDNAMLVDTLVAALARHPVLEVVSTAVDGAGVLDAVAVSRPDVVLLDLRLGGDWGLDLLPGLTAGERPPGVVVYSAAGDEATTSAARAAGAVAHLEKGAPLQELFDALVAAAPHGSGIPPQS